MKKVTAFVGSARKKNTYKAVMQFMNNLQTLGDIEYEIVCLSDYELGICRGCQLCFKKGETFCPLKDDQPGISSVKNWRINSGRCRQGIMPLMR